MLSRRYPTEPVVLCQGHPAVGELWGLACHPSRPLFVTASEDKSVCVWNMETKQLEARQQVRIFFKKKSFTFCSFNKVQSVSLLDKVRRSISL